MNIFAQPKTTYINEPYVFNETQGILNLIGNTPLLELTDLSFLPHVPGVRVFAKLEMMNYGGSVKDRAAYWMIQEAEKQGILRPGKTIVEATSGNTGIGLAWIARLKGYDTLIVMSESMSEERKAILRSYGAKLCLTPAEHGTDGAIRYARKLANENPNYVNLDQFSNDANWLAHYNTTGPEIWQQTNGTVTHLIFGVGTGGTIMGTTRYLREKNPSIKAIGIGPKDGTGIPGLKNLQRSMKPAIFKQELLDDYFTVDGNKALEVTRKLAREASLLVGPSSGGALLGVMTYMNKHKQNLKGNIVTLFPDTGSRYLSLNYY